MDTGLLILRLVVGLILAGHGSQKLFGLFGGYGLTGTSGWLESIGFRPGRPMAVLVGVAEVAGGLGLALGLLTPLSAAVVIGTMAVAVWTHSANGLWSTAGGYELPLTNAVVAAALAFTGAGSYSLDHALGLTFGTGYAVAAVALGLVAALAAVVRAKLALRSTSERVLANA